MRTDRILQAGDRIRVLIVDDSVVVRRTVTMALEGDAEIEVVGVASSGELALQKVDQLNPDIVTLDVEMPGMNGLDTLSELRRRRPTLRVVMLSSLTQKGAEVSMEALARGADDCASKSSGGQSIEESVVLLRQHLSPKLKQFFLVRGGGAKADSPPLPGSTRENTAQATARSTQPVDVIVLGISTGGPTALAQLLPALGDRLQIPLLIVQHMPPMFTKLLAERLNSQSALTVLEAEAGMPVEAGKVLIAPGDFHMQVRRRGTGLEVVLNQEAQENCCRPSVDVLFRSAAEIWGNRAAAVVMTGMGQDGCAGARSLRATGATVIAQDEASSVVWGMPGEVVRANLADKVVSLADMANEMVSISKRRKT